MLFAGSKEGHTAYLYRCTHGGAKKAAAAPIDAVKLSDPLFSEGFKILATDAGVGVAAWVDEQKEADDRMSGRSQKPRTRQQAKSDTDA